MTQKDNHETRLATRKRQCTCRRTCRRAGCHRGATNRGGTIIEMALVCLVFLMLLIGIMEMARAAWAREVISAAAREGARYAIVHGAASSNPSGPGQNDAMVERRVRQHCYGLQAEAVTVTSSWPLGRNDTRSTVKVEVRYQFTSAAGALIGRRQMELAASSEMLISR